MRRDLPSGEVTFLLTDIEGSTRLLHALGSRYASLLADHRDIMRAAFGAHGGGYAGRCVLHRLPDGVRCAARRGAGAAPARGP